MGPGAGSGTSGQPGLPVTLTFHATTDSVRGALAELRGCLSCHGLSSEELDTVELVVAEILNNVVEHAYGHASGGQVSLSAAAHRHGLAFRIEDDGVPMPGGALPEGRAPRIGPAVNDLPEGGFGWFMIRSLTRDLVYRRDGLRNCLTFRMNIAPALPG